MECKSRCCFLSLIGRTLDWKSLTESICEVKTEICKKITIYPYLRSIDKKNIYILIPKSIEDIKLNSTEFFELIPQMRFHVMKKNSIIPSVSHRLLYYRYYWSRLRKIYNARNISSKFINLERKTRHTVITHVNTSNDVNIPTFLGKKSLGMILYLSNVL